MSCAFYFPICEIGTDSERLCLSSCVDSMERECSMMAEYDSFCSNQSSVDTAKAALSLDSKEDSKEYGLHSPILDENIDSCFLISYEGPAVGMWVAGFTISLVFSVLNSIGINLQKYSLSRNAKASKKRNSCQQPLWLVGFMLVCLGSILDFVAFGMAPQSLLAPLAALTLVWNMFIAPIFHKEKITRQNIVATIIIFIGVTITVIFAGHSTPSYELKDLILLYQQPVMYAYITCVAIFLTVLTISAKRIESSGQNVGGLYHIICYGGIAGTFGGQSVLLAKSTVEMLKSALWGQGSTDFEHVETYLIIGGMVICLVSQITVLNGGLKRFDALVMIPVYQSFWILTSVLGGIMYFEEYSSMTMVQTWMFPLGGSVTLFGIFYLLRDRRHSQEVKFSELVELKSDTDSPTRHTTETVDSDEEAAQQRFDLDLDDSLPGEMDSGPDQKQTTSM